jgi:hypothetical protein
MHKTRFDEQNRDRKMGLLAGWRAFRSDTLEQSEQLVDHEAVIRSVLCGVASTTRRSRKAGGRC